MNLEAPSTTKRVYSSFPLLLLLLFAWSHTRTSTETSRFCLPDIFPTILASRIKLCEILPILRGMLRGPANSLVYDNPQVHSQWCAVVMQDTCPISHTVLRLSPQTGRILSGQFAGAFYRLVQNICGENNTVHADYTLYIQQDNRNTSPIDDFNRDSIAFPSQHH